VQPAGSQPPPLGAQLTVISLHVTIEFPRVIGNLYVDRWQAEIVPSRVAAKVQPAPLSGMSGNVPFSMSLRSSGRDSAGTYRACSWGQSELPGQPRATVARSAHAVSRPA
jgi:hypothetical protein